MKRNFTKICSNNNIHTYTSDNHDEISITRVSSRSAFAFIDVPINSLTELAAIIQWISIRDEMKDVEYLTFSFMNKMTTVNINNLSYSDIITAYLS